MWRLFYSEIYRASLNKILLDNKYELQYILIFFYRSVTVGQDSVNSVVMCEEPQDKRQRLMVAASISINAAGSNVTARYKAVLSKYLFICLFYWV